MKYTSKIKAALSLCAVALMAQSAMAVPARKGLQPYTLPDGKVIMVTLSGDEHSHYYTTEDGYMLLAAPDDYLCYASLAPDGTVISSGVRAHAIAERPAAEARLLDTIDRDAILTAWNASGRKNTTRAAEGPGRYPGAAFPSKGEQRALVILVEYQDVGFTIANPIDYFTRLLNEEGFSDYEATGSARDYFIKASAGAFTPIFDVYGPVKLPNKRSYYGGNDPGGDDLRPEYMVIQACEMLDDQVDFSLYDGDNDGMIDNVMLYYAGKGENDGGPASSVWPHSWTIADALSNPIYHDGKQLNCYACTNELQNTGKPDGIGTCVHEFSHVLGLPDLYTTTYTDAFTPGAWDVLDYGAYLNNSRTPPTYSAFARHALGWIEPEIISGPLDGYLPSLINSNSCYKIPTAKETEFFLLENRQQEDWDSYLPGHGMLVWHIDYNDGVWDRNVVNNSANHQYVDLEEADNVRSDNTRAADAFPGPDGKYTSFTDATKPSMLTWGGSRLNLPITDIAETDGLITFKVCGGMVAMLPVEVALNGAVERADSFSICWNPSEVAEDYLVTLVCGEETICNRVSTGNQPRYTFYGLEPLTEYSATVVVVRGKLESDPSLPLTVTTPAGGLENMAVKAGETTDITEEGATIHWTAMDGANDYILNLFTQTHDNPNHDTLDFVGGADILMEKGWNSSSTAFYTTSSFTGKASPSLKLTADGQYLQSPLYPDEVWAVSFWARGVSSDAANSIEVEVWRDNNWQSMATTSFSNEMGGSIYSFDEMPHGVKAIRLKFHKVGPGNLAIDDVDVAWGGPRTPQPVDGYTDYHAGNVTELAVSGLLPGTEYLFTLVATDGAVYSPVSMAANFVTLPDLSSVPETTVQACWAINGRRASVNAPVGTLVRVMDSQGRVWYSSVSQGHAIEFTLPSSGLWLLSAGSEVTKILVP